MAFRDPLFFSFCTFRLPEFNREYVHSHVQVGSKSGAACAIKGVRATVQILDFIAGPCKIFSDTIQSHSDLIFPFFRLEIDLEMRFKNETGGPMEAVFKFLTTNEVMYGFEVHVNGKIIKGVCKEKEQARRDYDDAIAEGKGAYLAEQNEDDKRKSFDIMVGNLPDKTSCTVKLSYAQELSHEGTSVKFALPVTNLLRSVADENSTEGLSGFTFSADIVMGSEIVGLEAPSCSITQFGRKATLTSQPKSTEAGPILIKVADPYKSSAIVETLPKSRKDKAIMLSLFPRINTEVDTVTGMSVLRFLME